jgi:DNA-binding MarR family transcriptional regulator
LTEADYARLLVFRDGLRSFLRWSEAQARAVGLTASQHQLLLAVRGHAGSPSITDLADHLLLRHHSAVELVDRAATNGLVVRFDDPEDQRVTRVRLTQTGAAKIERLSAAHLEELSRVRSSFSALWDDLPDGSRGASDEMSR